MCEVMEETEVPENGMGQDGAHIKNEEKKEHMEENR